MISEETAQRIATALERLADAQERPRKGLMADLRMPKPLCMRCYPPCFRELGHLRDEEEKT